MPNESYWGDKPKISKVIFQFVTESAAELQAVKSGQVLAAYPQPQIGALDELDKNSNLKYVVSFGNVYEGLWLNSARFPLKSKAVRQAVMYATDRQAIVDQIVTPSVREGRVLESFIVPTFPQFYTPAFDIYGTKQDLAKVEELMTGDGWTKDGGVWMKNGKKAVLEIQTTAGNEARELTEQLWQSQLQQAGFQLKIKNPSADVLFGTNGPKGKFIVGLYAQVGTPDPGLCIIFCSKNIPTKKNGFVGQNWTRLVSQALDAPWAAADTELDDAARAQLVKQGQAATADDVVSIPLYQKPNIFVWDASKLSGPIADNATEGPFWNMNLWTLS